MSGAGFGVAVAQEVFAAAFEREGFVVELACLPGQAQCLQVQSFSPRVVAGRADHGRVAVQRPGFAALAADTAERVQSRLQ